jgi:hypothetical protein
MSDMVKDHTQDVADFQRGSSSGMDPDVKEFAAKTLPTLEGPYEGSEGDRPHNLRQREPHGRTTIAAWLRKIAVGRWTDQAIVL